MKFGNLRELKLYSFSLTINIFYPQHGRLLYNKFIVFSGSKWYACAPFQPLLLLSIRTGNGSLSWNEIKEKAKFNEVYAIEKNKQQ